MLPEKYRDTWLLHQIFNLLRKDWIARIDRGRVITLHNASKPDRKCLMFTRSTVS